MKAIIVGFLVAERFEILLRHQADAKTRLNRTVEGEGEYLEILPPDPRLRRQYRGPFGDIKPNGAQPWREGSAPNFLDSVYEGG